MVQVIPSLLVIPIPPRPTAIALYVLPPKLATVTLRKSTVTPLLRVVHVITFGLVTIVPAVPTTIQVVVDSLYTLIRLVVTPLVREVNVVPFVLLKITPLSPTTTHVVPSKYTSLSDVATPLVREVHVVPLLLV